MKKVLVVDSHKTFVMYARLLLERMGFEVVAAETSVEAMRLLSVEGPDLVLLDVNMPDTDGVTLLRQLRRDRQTASLPVVMISVDASEETATVCRQLGCSDFLTKPLTVSRLHQAIEKAVLLAGGSGRGNLRTKWHRPVTVRLSGKEEELAATCLSEGGISLEREDPIEAGSQLQVLLVLNGEELTLGGRVLYNRENDHGSATVAIAFDTPSSEQATLLNGYIHGLLAGAVDKGPSPL